MARTLQHLSGLVKDKTMKTSKARPQPFPHNAPSNGNKASPLPILSQAEKKALNRWMMLSGWTSRISLIDTYREYHTIE